MSEELSLEDLLNMYIEDAKIESHPAIEWLHDNTILGSKISKLNKKDLIRLLDKAFFALGHIQRQSIEIFKNDIEALSEATKSLNAGTNIILQNNQMNKIAAFEAYEKGFKDSKASNSSKGGKAKSEKYIPLKELAKELVKARENWPSRRNAAMTIAPRILEESEKLGINLSSSQAVITITDWLKSMGLPANR